MQTHLPPSVLEACDSGAANASGPTMNWGPLGPPLLAGWDDPVSGVESRLLSARVAPQQQSFYFCNPSISADGRYYWFYCFFPPAGSANQGRSLAVADFWKNRVTHFPETAFTDASPMVDPRTGEAYWCAGLEIWRRGPQAEKAPVPVNRFPESVARNRRPWRLATHLSLSADGKDLNIDAEFGRQWFVGHAPLDGGPVVIWQKSGHCHNHSLFSPADPDLQLLCESSSIDPLSGAVLDSDNPLRLIRRGGRARPVFPDPIPGGRAVVRKPSHGELIETPAVATDCRAMHGHHFWGADGRHVWYVHYETGVERVRLGSTVPELVWPHRTVSHAHANADGTLLVLDSLPPDQPEDRRVTFVNVRTGRTINIVSHMPDLPREFTRYHVHPHPQFCLSDRLVCYTTTVNGRADVAFVSVDALVARTS
jgi:hypothetical protein